MRNTFKQKILFISLFLFTSFLATAQDAGKVNAELVTDSGSWVYWGLLSVVVFLVFFFVIVFGRLKGIDGREPEQRISFVQWWSALDRRLFTKAVAIDKEQDVLLDHDYDGIKELDNALPPWWKYGFYITVVVAVFYMLRLHVWNTGPTPEQEYNREMKVAAAQIEEYRMKSNDMVDEKTVTMADAAGIAEGKKIYQVNCFACHGMNGEGGVGPNLTDDYWIHGGSINDVFKTIKFGVPDKGMQAWEKSYSPSQIKNISSYIKSIMGSRPANAKPPQGELYAEKKTDTVKLQPDSTRLAK